MRQFHAKTGLETFKFMHYVSAAETTYTQTEKSLWQRGRSYNLKLET